MGDADSDHVIVFLNGFAGHRLVAVFWHDWLKANKVGLITMDRPAAGHSTPCPVEKRVLWTQEALVAVLAKENVHQFTFMTHSNGIIYGLYFLLHLPPSLSCDKWFLSSPYIAPWHSSSLPLSVATYIPTGLTSNLGPVASGALSALSPLVAGITWSSGISSGLFKTNAASPTDSPAVAHRKATAKNHSLPPEKRLVSADFYGSALQDEVMKRIVKEKVPYLGAEALISLHKGEAKWHWPGEATGPLSAMFETAFTELKAKGVRMRVWYGDRDGLVPAKGRMFAKEVWSRVGILEGWYELRGGGHDEGLGREVVWRSVVDFV